MAPDDADEEGGGIAEEGCEEGASPTHSEKSITLQKAS